MAEVLSERFLFPSGNQVLPFLIVHLFAEEDAIMESLINSGRFDKPALRIMRQRDLNFSNLRILPLVCFWMGGFEPKTTYMGRIRRLQILR